MSTRKQKRASSSPRRRSRKTAINRPTPVFASHSIRKTFGPPKPSPSVELLDALLSADITIRQSYVGKTLAACDADFTLYGGCDSLEEVAQLIAILKLAGVDIRFVDGTEGGAA